MLATLFQKKQKEMLPESIVVDGNTLMCEWIAQTRKTFSVRWNEEGQRFVIKYPSFCGSKECADFFQKYKTRIARLYEKRSFVRMYNDGDVLPLYDKKIILRLLHGTRNNVQFNRVTDEVFITSRHHTQRTLKKAVSGFYAGYALELFEQLVSYHAKNIGVRISGITVRNQRSRWGSASMSGRLNFNFRLLLAPPKVLEYVVVHELMHLHHMNHSKDFWHAVASYMPEYARHKKWLKDNGRELVL